MVENVADLTLERVRRIEGKIDMLVDHVVEVKVGLTLLKNEMATMHARWRICMPRWRIRASALTIDAPLSARGGAGSI